MICSACADAADEGQPIGHDFCVGKNKGCYCLHRINAVVIKKEEND